MQAAIDSRDALLPPEVSANTPTWFGRARNYPIFSFTWYRYRSLALVSASVLLLLIVCVWMGAALPGAWLASMILVPFYVLCLAGPGLAVLIGRLKLRRRLETIALLGALLLGMALSGGTFWLLGSDRTHFRLDSDILIVEIAPKLSLSLDFRIEQGALSGFSGWRRRPGQPIDVPAPSPAILSPANYAYLGSEGQRALADMQKLDDGDPSIDPARRPEIEKKYAAAVVKMSWHPKIVFPRTGQVYPFPWASSYAPPPPNPFLTKLNSLADAVFAGAAMLLAAWLGGMFDLIAFVRQRGKLVDVLQKEEFKRAQAERNSAEMRLSVLAAQVEPHFLFNTLASVRSAISSDPQRATRIVDHMVSFLRSTIPQMRDEAGSASVRLSTQMDSAHSYLALMHERITRLAFGIDTEPGLENASIPPLMLISLVENAVKHGVEPKVGPARIDVRARRIDAQEAQLEICVSDDGVGFGETASGDGIGLTNIQERLRSYFGQRASLTLKALPDGGVAAILRLPLSFES
jgi:two-component sensor histidine kinase